MVAVVAADVLEVVAHLIHLINPRLLQINKLGNIFPLVICFGVIVEIKSLLLELGHSLFNCHLFLELARSLGHLPVELVLEIALICSGGSDGLRFHVVGNREVVDWPA